MTLLDDDAITACADLVGRTGATEFQIGFLSDEPPHGWYATAKYRGARISEDDHKGPVEAADALCRRLLTGATCQHCGGFVVLSDSHVLAEDGPRCRWRRMGPKWVMGCEKAEATS